ncbi:MAG: AAA family ATPase [Leptospira sp.]|nr:AAA family ATPase [Leptospira sp.]
MNSPFQKAALQQKKWRLLLRGVSGSGKTRSSLIIAKELAEGGKICLVDTEKMSSTHNAKDFDFDVVDYNLITSNDHNPERYIKLIELVEQEDYKVLIIDSFSHSWMGVGGILDIVNNLTQTKYKGNSYRSWTEGNQLYQSLINKIFFGNDMHVILTGRTKQAYEMSTKDDGKKEVIKKGMELQQRDGLDYEFDTVLDFDNSKPGYGIPEKDRTNLFSKTGEMITQETGKKLLNYIK